MMGAEPSVHVRPSYVVGLLLPVSYGTKLIWNLEIPFVEPAFVLVLWLWWRQRAVAPLTRLEWALVASFVLSTVAALRHDLLTTARWLDAWSHSARTFALLATIAWSRSLDGAHREKLLEGMQHGLSIALSVSVLLVLIGLGWLPNILGVDSDYVDYDGRFALHLGPLTLPRLIGLCVEPAPFGAQGVAALVLARSVPERVVARAQAITRRAWLIVVGSFSDQAFLGASLLLVKKRRGDGGRSPLRWFAAFVAVIVLVPYLVDRLTEKATEFTDLADDPLALERLWGSSGGERILNSILALGVATDSLMNLLVGVGPSLFGLFVSDIFPVLQERHQVQVLPPDLLCSVGVLGTGLVIANAIAWWRRAPGALSSLLALLLANLFQSDFKSPALGVAIGCSIASVSSSHRQKGTKM